MKKSVFSIAAVMMTAALAVNSCQESAPKGNQEFWMGADMSGVTGQELRGQKFYNEDGSETDEMTIFANLGVNAARFRVWVDPVRGFQGMVGGDGLEIPEGKEHAGLCDKEDVLEKCLRAKALGMDIMIDFHYADSWADPQKQPIPRAWADDTFEELVQHIYDHTFEVMTYLKENGIEPKWAQIGNETSNGMMWNCKLNEQGWEDVDPYGHVTVMEDMGHIKTHPDHYAAFVKAGHEAVKKVVPECKTIVHLDNGYDQVLYDGNLGTLAQYDTPYDMIGMSMYPYFAAKNSSLDDPYQALDMCISNINHLYERFGKETIIVEVGFGGRGSADQEEGYNQFTYLVDKAKNGTNGHCHGIFYFQPGLDRDGKPGRVLQVYADNK